MAINLKSAGGAEVQKCRGAERATSAVSAVSDFHTGRYFTNKDPETLMAVEFCTFCTYYSYYTSTLIHLNTPRTIEEAL